MVVGFCGDFGGCDNGDFYYCDCIYLADCCGDVFNGFVDDGLCCCCGRCLIFYEVIIFTAAINSLFTLDERCHEGDVNLLCFPEYHERD